MSGGRALGTLDLIRRGPWRYRDHRALGRFLKKTAGIFETPPVRTVPGPPRIVSMISMRHLQTYLIAIKAFLTRLGRGEVICIVDAAFPDHARDLLERHIHGIQFELLETLDPSPCQRGGTWERLVYVLEQSRDMYTIQIDSDCLAFGDLREVVESIAANRSFAVTNAGKPIRTMRAWAEDAKGQQSGYVGIRAERLFEQFPGCEELKYVRASSGFCGYARGGFARQRLDAFHETMASLLGPSWQEWGTEQTGSNFVIANSENAQLLPFPKYTNFFPERDADRSAFLHFFGTYRFVNDVFLQRSLQVISELQRSV
jgi:hypothetical protein